MTAIELISELRNRDVKLWLDGDRLCYSAPEGVMTTKLLAELAGCKTGIVSFLRYIKDRRTVTAPPLQPVPRDGELPLSFSQRRFWFLDQWEPGNPFYNIPAAASFHGRLNPLALGQSINEIIRCHEILRTNFATVDDHPAQMIAPFLNLSLRFIELSDLSESDRARTKERLMREEARRPFHLATGPLLRASLLRLSSEEHILLFTMHHIVSDGWSVGLLIQSVGRLYTAYGSGEASPLVELPIQYADYAHWQRQWLKDKRLSQQLSYWVGRLATTTPLLDLPLDRPRPARRSFAGARQDVSIPVGLSAAVRALARQEGVTIFMLLMAAWQALLSRYAGQRDFCVGTPVAGRGRVELENLIGYFANTMALKADLSGDPDFRVILKRVREEALGAYGHQELPFERLVEELRLERSLNYNPLFQVLFAWQNTPREKFELRDLSVSLERGETATSRFDLSLELLERDDAIGGQIEYSTELFEEVTVMRLWRRLCMLLESVVSDPGQRLSRLPLMMEMERQQVIVEFNDTRTIGNERRRVQERFAEVAREWPEAVALSRRGESVTYGEVETRSNQLARRLGQMGVGLETVVGVLADGSVEMVVAMLGVLKAGCAYLPVEPKHPVVRRDEMLRASGVKLVLSGSRPGWKDLPRGVKELLLEEEWEKIGGECHEEMSGRTGSGNLAYVFYTSGSTGKPQGVMVEHGGLVHLVETVAPLMRLGGREVWTLAHSCEFDLSVWEMWGSLLTGGRLALMAEEEVKDVREFLRVLVEEQVTVLNLTPTGASYLIKELEARGCVKEVGLGVRVAVCGGELLSREVGQRMRTVGEELWRFYGLAEATVWTAASRVEEAREWWSVGRGLPDRRIYVLEEGGVEAALPGGRGELYLGGEGIARGYVGNAEQTAERFRPDPYCEECGGRMYASGDIARWSVRGELEYVGRKDNQVKVRGRRVELGEMEAVLDEHETVRKSQVIMGWRTVKVKGGERREDGKEYGREYLMAYVKAADGKRAEFGELKRYLRERLPEYMTPAGVEEVEEWPLTRNGKIDRESLRQRAEEEKRERKLKSGRKKSRSVVWGVAAGIWEDVLGLEEIEGEENFFDLGGNSLLVTRVLARLSEALRVEVSVSEFLESPTMEGLVNRIEEKRRDGHESHLPPIPQTLREGKLPLTFTQRRLWFLDQLTPGSGIYNIPFGVRLIGPLNISALEQSLREIVRRHEILRTTIAANEGEPAQVVAAHIQVPLSLIDLSDMSEEMSGRKVDALAAEDSRRPFALSQGPLLRVGLLHLSEREHVFLLNMHHVISDEWSVGVFMREMTELYRAFRDGTGTPLPELPIQYADYALWRRQRLQRNLLEGGLSYWKKQLNGAPVLELSAVRARPAVQSYRGAREILDLSEELTTGLKALGRRSESTLFMTLLASFQTLLYRYTGQKDICMGTLIAGRAHPQLEGLIGCFVNTLALRCDLTGNPDFGELLKRVRTLVLEAQAHQEIPFERLLEELQTERDLSRSPLFQVMFMFQDTPGGGTRIPHLDLIPLIARTETTKFDLTLSVAEESSRLTGYIEYSTDLFDGVTVRRMIGHWRRLLISIVSNPAQSLSSLSLLTEEEQHQLRVEWNGTQSSYPGDVFVHQLFESEVGRRPDAIAMQFQDEQLSFEELNRRANQLAHYLRKLGVGPEIIVGICIERSLEMMVGLLGTLKAGGGYLPLDPDYPNQRLMFMLQHSRTKVILTKSSLVPQVSDEDVHFVLVDKDWEAIAREPSVNASSGVKAQNLAYVIYTSGSTGEPKGVMVSHRNVINFFSGMDARLQCDAEDRLLALTSISFDISVLELFWTLAHGVRVILLSEPVAGNSYRQSGLARLSKGMAFSLFYFANDRAEEAEDRYRLLIEGAKFADKHGFQAVWTPERHFHEFGGLYPNPSVTSAALATVTKRVHLRAGSVVMPLHDPIRVAEEWSVVDNLSNGRVGISFASGWHADDFTLRPENYADRSGATLRGIETVRKLWGGESIKVNNGAGKEIEVRIFPKPVRSQLPLWITTAGNPQTFVKAGELGANVLTHLLGQTVEEVGAKINLYRETLAKSGYDPQSGQVTLMLHTFIGEDRETVREIVRAPFINYLRSSVGLIANIVQSLSLPFDMDRLSEDDMAAVLDLAFSRYFETSALLGTPASCSEMIENLKEIGVDEVACLIDFGVDVASTLASLHHLNELKNISNRRVEVGSESIEQRVKESSTTLLQSTPSTFIALSNSCGTMPTFQSLRTIMLGGEALSAPLARQIKGTLRSKLFNMYGPTETTIWSAMHEVGEEDETISIGRPINNTRIHIINGAGQTLPIVTAGELYIGGDGLARGYLESATLTAGRFIPDSFSDEPGQRLYRTGDIASYFPDGRIDYVGRSDQQVKIRGFRIELGEVEAVLGRHMQVQQAVVCADKDTHGDARLIAYVVPRGKQPHSVSALRQYLKQWLPDYMIPSAFIFVEALPLTPNNKIDRQALLLLGNGQDQSEMSYSVPTTVVEHALVEIWSEVLRRDRIGVLDNFFEIGGHSLMAVRLNSRIEAKFGVGAPLQEFFTSPTIRDLARWIEEAVLAASNPENADETLNWLDDIDESEALRMLGVDGPPEEEGAGYRYEED